MESAIFTTLMHYTAHKVQTYFFFCIVGNILVALPQPSENVLVTLEKAARRRTHICVSLYVVWYLLWSPTQRGVCVCDKIERREKRDTHMCVCVCVCVCVYLCVCVC